MSSPDCAALRHICKAPCCNWGCKFFQRDTKTCACYRGRPAACRLFDCRRVWPDQYAEWERKLKEEESQL